MSKTFVFIPKYKISVSTIKNATAMYTYAKLRHKMQSSKKRIAYCVYKAIFNLNINVFLHIEAWVRLLLYLMIYGSHGILAQSILGCTV